MCAQMRLRVPVCFITCLIIKCVRRPAELGQNIPAPLMSPSRLPPVPLAPLFDNTSPYEPIKLNAFSDMHHFPLCVAVKVHLNLFFLIFVIFQCNLKNPEA